LAEHAPDLEIIAVEESTASVAEAAAALGVKPRRIAKTLAIRIGERNVLLVASGDPQLDNAKWKSACGSRPRMLGADEALAVMGHSVGGICPFGLATPVPVYCDVSLRTFDEVLRPPDRSPARSGSLPNGCLVWSRKVGWTCVGEAGRTRGKLGGTATLRRSGSVWAACCFR
jgi:prolyl-tRNA editing enzyme YbaK/EbsC (Cys-tRNA(Pro) deacylase)